MQALASSSDSVSAGGITTLAENWVSNAAKGLLRGIVRGSRAVAERIDSTEIAGNFNNPDFVYAALNTLLRQFMSEEPSVLRSSYTWGTLHAAHLAKSVGITHISVVEFGVAGGNGLVALERAARRVQSHFGITIDVHGFDTGIGLPPPTDYRDLPNIFRQSEYRMDVDALRQRLRHAQLHIGLVGETVERFVASRPAPVGFISFDLDYYTSTMDAFTLLEADESLMLPRIHCYFDDIMGFTFSEFTGERLAIDEFNAAHVSRKISPIYGLRYFLPRDYAQQQWSEMFYMAHLFDHPLYPANDGLVVSAQRTLRA